MVVVREPVRLPQTSRSPPMTATLRLELLGCTPVEPDTHRKASVPHAVVGDLFCPSMEMVPVDLSVPATSVSHEPVRVAGLNVVPELLIVTCPFDADEMVTLLPATR